MCLLALLVVVQSGGLWVGLVRLSQEVLSISRERIQDFGHHLGKRGLVLERDFPKGTFEQVSLAPALSLELGSTYPSGPPDIRKEAGKVGYHQTWYRFVSVDRFLQVSC